MTEYMINKIRLAGLKKQRQQVCDEFDKWPMFYTSRWFINQMAAIDKQIWKMELPSDHPLNQSKPSHNG